MNPNTIKCQCLHCGGNIEFEEEAAGQEIPCPHCGKLTWIDLPGRMNYKRPHAFNPADAKARAAGPEKPSFLKLEDCLDCGKAISKNAVICPQCGTIPSLVRTGWKVTVISIVVALIFGLIMAVLNEAIKTH